MIDDFFDRADAFSERWKTVISALSVAWFVATCADYAGFIKLPIELPLSEWLGFLPVVLWNALWWGLAYPRIAARREQRRAMETNNG